MASKSTIKLVAKYNALKLAARVIDNHCSAYEFDDLEGLPEGLLDQVDKELAAIVRSLHKRADKAKGDFDIPDLIEAALAE